MRGRRIIPDSQLRALLLLIRALFPPSIFGNYTRNSSEVKSFVKQGLFRVIRIILQRLTFDPH